MSVGPQFRIKCGDIAPLDRLDRLVLMAPGSITHHSDMSARHVDITGVPVNGNLHTMQFTLPANGAVPRGFYMMFALNGAGVPSVATWVKVV